MPKEFADSMLTRRRNPAEGFLTIPESAQEKPAEKKPADSKVKEAEKPAAKEPEQVQNARGPEPAAAQVAHFKEDFPSGAGEGYYTVSGVVGGRVERKTKPVNFLFRQSTYDILKARAKIQGISANEILHYLIEKYCVD